MRKMLTAILSVSLLLCMSMTVFAGTWKQDARGWWYQNDDETWPRNEWKYMDNEWYYFEENGYMATGWKHIDNTWYYFEENGHMVTGWWRLEYELEAPLYSAMSWFYFTGTGAMATSGDYITGSIQPNGAFKNKHRVYWGYNRKEIVATGGGVSAGGYDLEWIDLSPEAKEFWTSLVKKYGYDKLQKEETDEHIRYTIQFSKMPHNDELVPADRMNLIRARAYLDGHVLEGSQIFIGRAIDGDEDRVVYEHEKGSYYTLAE